MTIKEFGIQFIRKTVIIALSIAFSLWITTYYFSTLPEGM